VVGQCPRPSLGLFWLGQATPGEQNYAPEGGDGRLNPRIQVARTVPSAAAPAPRWR